MARKVSIETVAREVGVSTSTVSRVMNGHPAISEPVRQQVLRASRKLKFIPRTRIPSVAMIVDPPRHWHPVDYVGILLSLLTRQLANRSYALEVVESSHLDIATQLQIHAAIGIVFDDRIKELAKLPNLPVLTINEPVLEYGVHSFCTDHAMGAHKATTHLLEYGHRRIAFLEDSGKNWGARERLRGYREALQTAGVPFDPEITFLSTTQPLVVILNRLRRLGCTALLNCSGDCALEASYVLTHEMGVRIPEDISVITIEANPVTQYLSPPHTAIEEKYFELTSLVVDSVVDLVEGRMPASPPHSVLLEVDLAKRGSVAPPPSP